MTKASQLRDMTVDELKLAVDDVNKELFALINETQQTKTNAKPHLVPEKRKHRARLLTIIHEKQLGISKPARGN